MDVKGEELLPTIGLAVEVAYQRRAQTTVACGVSAEFVGNPLKYSYQQSPIYRTIALLAIASACVMGCSIPLHLSRADKGGSGLQKWTGVAPSAGLVYDDGTCGQDVEFELTRTGDTLNGWIRSARVVNSNCPSILSLEQRTQQLSPSLILGTLKQSVISLTIVQARTNNGVPNRVTVISVSGMLKDDQLSTSGTLFGPRTWLDLNRDGIPNCDFAVRDTNGECGRDTGEPRSMTFGAKRANPR